MDTTDLTETTSTDLVVLDAEQEESETPSFGKEVAKTLALSTATSAVVFGGLFAAAVLIPKVADLLKRRKKDVIEAKDEALDKAAAKAESLKTEQD